ncbi:MAG: flagellar biosynthesis anti-sigma factor FlgM [Mariprofundales bacterium]|nr:flagellar biosynthesis anti-sigma factor FlgM [Mariprofundales bacterium]
MVRIAGMGGARGVLQTNKGGNRKGAGKAKGGRASDQVRVADASSLHERAKVMLADMPEVRMERIEGIRDALEKGTFQMNEKQVAVRIVRNALVERAWS